MKMKVGSDEILAKVYLSSTFFNIESLNEIDLIQMNQAMLNSIRFLKVPQR